MGELYAIFYSDHTTKMKEKDWMNVLVPDSVPEGRLDNEFGSYLRERLYRLMSEGHFKGTKWYLQISIIFLNDFFFFLDEVGVLFCLKAFQFEVLMFFEVFNFFDFVFLKLLVHFVFFFDELDDLRHFVFVQNAVHCRVSKVPQQ